MGIAFIIVGFLFLYLVYETFDYEINKPGPNDWNDDYSWDRNHR